MAPSNTLARARLSKLPDNKRQGMNWITQHKRLAIYLRDGLSCAWCGLSIEDGIKLTLDHLTPHSKGGTNSERNLVTSCLTCNSSRGNRSLLLFSRAVANYVNHGTTAQAIRDHIRITAARTLPLGEAKTLIARRGTAAKALNQFR